MNVIIIGGGASGLQSAISAKSTYPDKSVVLVRKEEQALVPCGIPYIFGSLECSDKDIMPDQLLAMQIGTHPLLTGSPAGYPLIKAAEILVRKLKRKF